MTVRWTQIFGLTLLVCLCVFQASADEGMFPMSDLEHLDLQSAGLELEPDQIYNPHALALVDGICKIGGCTGSFVSAQGLILTNHHCAFRSIQAASTEDHDYLADGFTSLSLAEEFPATGYTVRLTESYRDVSQEVLSVVTADMDPVLRTRAIEKRMKEISLAEEAAQPGKRAEVSEMFLGRTYVLFVYTYLKDLRLVYAPPRAIGNYGGEEDNWIWPRHTADFSFMRAYVGPDGAPAEYSPDNIPYEPRQVLQVSDQGVAENDFVFLFGYPGSTYRHRTSFFLRYETDLRMPLVLQWYGWQIDQLQALGRENPQRHLRLASRLKSLHNTHKNYRGKMQGIARLDLIQQKQSQEGQLQAFIDGQPRLKAQHGDLLQRLEAYHTQLAQTVRYDLWLRFMLRSPYVMKSALTIWENALEQKKPESERESAYMARNLDQTLNALKIRAENYDPQADQLILAKLLLEAGEIEAANPLTELQSLAGPKRADAAEKFLRHALNRTQLMDPSRQQGYLEMSEAALRDLDDPILNLVASLYGPYLELREQRKHRKGELDQLQAAMIDVKQAFLGQAFIPDANGTLRFTYGRVEGYSPRDAVWLTPLTTLTGMVEKDTGQPPYKMPERLQDLIHTRDFGGFASDALGDIPVNILYSTDTTGGNSGSPVFNATGQVVGLNFDRAWEATINDFAWDHSYSRSIGVDIRYVLWTTWKFSGTDRLLKEMNVEFMATGASEP